ncbi:MAG: hypothetical protein EXR76_02310 [Myxococcales bacterium]|nr:hypothetical protein [Myxococcales bacterium]
MRHVVFGWTLSLSLAAACVAPPSDDSGSADGAPSRDRSLEDARRLFGDASTRPSEDATLADSASLADNGLDADDLVPVQADASAPVVPACRNGVDDDGDGRTDHPSDRGCMNPDDGEEAGEPALPECIDAVDQDGDGFIDLDDPGCSSEGDPREGGDAAVTQCNDGLDQDGNGLFDYPNDPGCTAAGDDEESSVIGSACSNGDDDDADGLIDRADPGCASAGDRSEVDPPVAGACNNGLDDDGDGAMDFPGESGCESPGDPSEAGACGPGLEPIDLDAHLRDSPFYAGETPVEGGRFVGTCGGGAGGELIFAYDVSSPLERVTFSTEDPATTGPVVMYIRRNCLAAAELACNRGNDANPGTHLTVEAPPRGRYFIFVDAGQRDQASPFHLIIDSVPTPACRNALDDDSDGVIDNADPGCIEGEDPEEADPDVAPVCSNGLDDDEDGQIDFGPDADCEFAGGDREVPLCPDGVPMITVEQAGGRFELPPPPPAPGNAAGSCDVGFGGEAVLVINLDSPSEVTVEIMEAGVRAQLGLYGRRDCGDAGSEIACRGGAGGGQLRFLDLPRGKSFVFVELGFVNPAQPRTAVVTIVSILTECNDELDNDRDGLVDRLDTGCEGGRDMAEDNPIAVPICANGLDDDADGRVDYPDDAQCDAAGDPEEMQECLIGVFGGVCVNWLSVACIPGSATAICAMENRGRIPTYAEFMALAGGGGWVRPDGNYHTVTVDQYPDCGGAIGNTGIPGWGQFNLFNCGDDANYCNRAVMCVR